MKHLCNGDNGRGEKHHIGKERGVIRPHHGVAKAVFSMTKWPRHERRNAEKRPGESWCVLRPWQDKPECDALFVTVGWS